MFDHALPRTPAPRLHRLKAHATKHFSVVLAMAAATSLLSACSGGSTPGVATTVGSGSSSSTASVSTTLSGTVAVGAPMTDGKLKIVDANGNVVAQNISVGADGDYSGITLTGAAPYRLEACGYVGAEYTCLYSVVQGAGTGNVTPLTNAIVLLASGEQPGDIMSGNTSNLDSTHIADAGDTLRNALGGVLSDAGVANNFDFIGGDLNAGSRTGYDRVLDSVGVTTGEDTLPFVQISPRLGSGNIYIESGSAAAGSITVDTNAGTVSLSGIETLFANMSAALVSANACANGSTGMASFIAPNAHMNMGSGDMVGPAQVGAGICQYFAMGGEGGGGPMWGSQLISPKLGRCDFSGANPVCRISFALKDPAGEIANVGDGMGVERVSGVWKFMGNVDPVSIHANATAQRDRRVDSTGATVVDNYTRALQFDIQAINGLQCARIDQPDATGNYTTMAYFKLFGSGSPQRLSLWTSSSMGNERSLDPAVGFLRSSDDTWIGLPQGTDGDSVVRNFFRGGRTVLVSLYSDAACSTPFVTSNGHSTLEVDVQGVPPVWSALAEQSWATVIPASIADLIALDVPVDSTATFTATFGFEHGSIGLNDASLCADRSCGEGGASRVASRNLTPGARSVNFAITTTSLPLSSTGFKLISLYGRDADGMALQSNLIYCPAVAAGEQCH